MKLCRDAQLLDSHLTRTNVDLIFTKVKAKGTTRLSYDQFLQALRMFAEKKRQHPTKIMLQVASIHGPTVSGTVADPNRFHDDKSTYTGVYSRGGPTKIDNVITQENLLDRSSADVRGTKVQGGPAITRRTLNPGEIGLQAQMSGMSITNPDSFGSPNPTQPTPQNTPSTPGGSTPFGAMLAGQSAEEASHFTASDLEDHLFNAYCEFCAKTASEPMMDSAGFVKFCRDMKILGKGFTTTDCDLIFQKSKSGGNYAKRISYTEFRQVAVPLVAQKRKISEHQLLERCSKVQGKVLTGTVASYNKFHDDKSTYTGVYAKGGPTKIDNVITQEMLANRDVKATIRGVPDRPDGYFTSADSGVGAVPKQPRYNGKEIIHETPMYNRGDSGKLPEPPHPKAQHRQSATLNRLNSSGPAAPPVPLQQPQRTGGFSLNRSNPPAPPSGAALKRQSGIIGTTFAGEANRPGGVYDRLSNKSTFTGVYAKRFDRSDPLGGRINGDTINGRAAGYVGNTNTGTDQRVDDISQILRR